MGAITSGFTPRQLTIFADVHKKHDKRSFLARDGQFFVAHFRSTEDQNWNNQERRVQIHDLSIIDCTDMFHLDHTPFENVGLYQSMDFFAALQKFYDEEMKPGGLRAPSGYWDGLYKQMPQGASVTQVLYASLPRIGKTQGYWTWAPWARPRTRPLTHFYFRHLLAK